MKTIRLFSVVLLGIALSGLGTLPTLAHSGTTQSSTALERGYRTGYSDGYNAGYKDIADRAPSDFQNKEDFQRADRAYNQAWGSLEDYRDGYQQGYAAGYEAGYDQRPFNSSLPTVLARRGPSDGEQTGSSDEDYSGNTGSAVGGNILIPQDTILLVALESSLSTDASQRGDRFQARVIEPGEYQGAIVEGRVAQVKRPGKVRGVAELQLTFDQIRMPDNRSNNFSADVIEVIESGTDGVGKVDPEGGVKGKDSTKDDVTRVGASTGIGAVIGAIFGGGKGAAVGAAIGGAVGAGSVVTQRGKEIRLDRGQQLRIRTATDTRIQ